MEFRAQRRNKFDCLIFDLDDTLYPWSSGLAAACLKNIGDYMFEKLEIEQSRIPELCSVLYKNYGTTMAGLRAIGYKFDYDDYHSFVHGRLPYENLRPDPALRQILMSLPIRKLVFTNADKMHAVRVLKRLGLEDCFQGIICFETLNPPPPPPPSSSSSEKESNIFDIVAHFAYSRRVDELPKTPILCKPSAEAMDQALRTAGVDPDRSIFFDDSARNIEAGKRIGLRTVLVGCSRRVEGADYALESIHNMKEAIPELWEEAEKAGKVHYSEKMAPEASVIA